MRHRLLTIVPVLAALALTSPAFAQALPDFSGTWSLDMQATLEPAVGAPSSLTPTPGIAAAVVCHFSGQVTLAQDGSSVFGPVDMTLESGGVECPPEMAGNLSGTVSSDLKGSYTINGAINGTLGSASFSGTLSSPSPGVPALLLAAFQGGGSGGDIDVTEGPFAGASGTWSATLLAPVPTLTPVALLVLVILLLTVGAFALRRDPDARAGS